MLISISSISFGYYIDDITGMSVEQFSPDLPCVESFYPSGNYSEERTFPMEPLRQPVSVLNRNDNDNKKHVNKSLPRLKPKNLKKRFFDIEKKVLNCPQCKYMTDRKNNLKRHIVTMHQNCPKTLECCGVLFESKSSLREHVALFHSSGYQCQVCGRNFCRKALLRRHLSVHSGQKDYKCPFCSYATSHKSNLERHQKVHGKKYSNIPRTKATHAEKSKKKIEKTNEKYFREYRTENQELHIKDCTKETKRDFDKYKDSNNILLDENTDISRKMYYEKDSLSNTYNNYLINDGKFGKTQLTSELFPTSYENSNFTFSKYDTSARKNDLKSKKLSRKSVSSNDNVENNHKHDHPKFTDCEEERKRKFVRYANDDAILSLEKTIVSSKKSRLGVSYDNSNSKGDLTDNISSGKTYTANCKTKSKMFDENSNFPVFSKFEGKILHKTDLNEEEINYRLKSRLCVLPYKCQVCFATFSSQMKFLNHNCHTTNKTELLLPVTCMMMKKDKLKINMEG